VWGLLASLLPASSHDRAKASNLLFVHVPGEKMTNVRNTWTINSSKLHYVNYWRARLCQ